MASCVLNTNFYTWNPLVKKKKLYERKEKGEKKVKYNLSGGDGGWISTIRGTVLLSTQNKNRTEYWIFKI